MATTLKYPVQYKDLPFHSNGNEIETFLAQLDALSTFGLYDAAQLVESMNGSVRCWNTLSQLAPSLAYSQAPILLVTCTMDINGNIWMSPNQKTLAQLRYILLHVPQHVVILVAVIPWDPLVTGHSIWTRINPISDTEDAKISCDKQCEPWNINSIQRQWTNILRNVLNFNAVQIHLMQARTVYLCIPSLILKHKWTGNATITQTSQAHDRRRLFVTDFVLCNTPNFKHCVSWLALDENHIDGDITQIAHTDIPWSETQFINTLVLPRF